MAGRFHGRLPTRSAESDSTVAISETRSLEDRLPMKFSLESSALYEALCALSPPRTVQPLESFDKSKLRIKATADGVTLETDQSHAFLRAQVATCGVCVVTRDAMTLAAVMCSSSVPVKVELCDGRLHLGPCSVEVQKQFF